MAYQVRQRDPLLDSKMQAAIERRGKELLGLASVKPWHPGRADVVVLFARRSKLACRSQMPR